MSDYLRNREFIQLWTTHGQRIYAYILTLLPNRSDADDIFQETGVTLWEKFDQFESGTNFNAWAFQTAWNKVRNFRQLRRHGMVLLSNESIDRLSQTVLSHSAELDGQHAVLADCYEKLSPRDRELIDMRYQPGVTVQDMAKELGRNADAVYKHLSRVHRALLECVQSGMDEEASP
ncbi:MAG: sigma-70 family RNA polymerase sigma factor [Pirellulaceae bacterium]|nr:sigma-70 family RNA polymerase sigma factor [Pirellulaceae bacterium]